MTRTIADFNIFFFFRSFSKIKGVFSTVVRMEFLLWMLINAAISISATDHVVRNWEQELNSQAARRECQSQLELLMRKIDCRTHFRSQYWTRLADQMDTYLSLRPAQTAGSTRILNVFLRCISSFYNNYDDRAKLELMDGYYLRAKRAGIRQVP